MHNQQYLNMHQAPRCTARSKQTAKPCQSPAFKGYRVCRMHGAGGGAPNGNRNARKHGDFGCEAIESRREIRRIIRESRKLIEAI